MTLAADYLCDVSVTCATCNVDGALHDAGTGAIARLVKQHARHDVEFTFDNLHTKRGSYKHRAYTIAVYT